MSALTIRELLDKAIEQLVEVTDEVTIEAEVLLSHVAKLSTTKRVVDANEVLSEPIQFAFEQAVEQRLNGQPIAYITGQKPFYDIDLWVNPGVLIPRSDTELLVDLALLKLPIDAKQQVLDLGTGSGAIALSIAKHRPQAQVVGVDISQAACEVAMSNATKLQLTNVSIVQGSWFEPLADQQFDLIISNPPYIDGRDPHLSRGDLRFEPQSALVASGSGLACYKEIIGSASEHLNDDTTLMFEHGYDQAKPISALLAGKGYTAVTTHRDLSGHQRVTVGSFRI